MRSEVNGMLERRNGVLKVTQLPKMLETTDEGIAKIVKTSRLVGGTIRRKVNSTPQCQNCVF